MSSQFDAQLFYGLPLDEAFAKAIDSLDPQMRDLFIQPGGKELVECQNKGVRYLGKTLGGTTTISKIELLEQNVMSLLRRLVPDYPFEGKTLILFATVSN